MAVTDTASQRKAKDAYHLVLEAVVDDGPAKDEEALVERRLARRLVARRQRAVRQRIGLVQRVEDRAQLGLALF